MKVFAVINGAAGAGTCRARAEAHMDTLRGAGFDIHAARTERPGHATDLAAGAWSDGWRAFLSVGGDGTAFEVINGLLPASLSSGERFTLGQLPLGSGNSFLRDFAIDSPDAAMAALLRCTPRPVDAVRITHAQGVTYYINLLSLGFSASVADLTNRRFKRFGVAGYALAVTASVARLAPHSIPIALDDGPFDARPVALLTFSNSQFTGGTMHMAPGASVADGKLDVIRVGARGRLSLLRQFPTIYRGTHIHQPGIEAAQVASVRFQNAAESLCMIDGEVMPLSLQRLDVIPHAFDLFG